MFLSAALDIIYHLITYSPAGFLIKVKRRFPIAYLIKIQLIYRGGRR